MSITLRCTAGPAAGERMAIAAELVLGREQPEPGRLRGDSRLSRRHARVFIDDSGRPTVEDLGSTNGTWVNGERLRGARILVTGDELQVGQTSFEVDVPAQPPTTELDTAGAAASPAATEVPTATPQLLMLAGPKPGQEIPLGDELLIGRGYGEPGALGGDRLLSRRHARIARGPGGVFFIEDTGSTNGTMLNGVRLRRANVVRNGDEIQLGSCRLEARGFPATTLAAELGQEQGPAPAPVAAPGLERAAVGHFMPQGAAGARLSSRRIVGVFASVFVGAAIVAAAVVLLAAPLGSRACPQGFVCHKPPTAPPLRALATFSGSLGWRVEYDSQMVTPASESASGNQIALHESDAQDRLWGASPGSGIIGVVLHAYRSSQTSPQAATQSLASSLGSRLVGATAAPTSDQMFGVPVLGFHPAQGEVLEGSLRTPQGPGGLTKVAVLSTSSGGVTIAAAVVYPVQQGNSQQANPDRPLDEFGDQILETVRFPSDGQA